MIALHDAARALEELAETLDRNGQEAHAIAARRDAVHVREEGDAIDLRRKLHLRALKRVGNDNAR